MRRNKENNRRAGLPRRRAGKKRSILLQSLENRLLFSAAPVPAFELPPENLIESVDSAATHDRSAELIFVDRSIENGQDLAERLRDYGTNSDNNRSLEIHFIDTDENGLSRIAEVLNGRSNVSAIHVISHGDEAQLQLGNTTLTVDSMRSNHAADLEIIRNSLSADADFLIYGCNFGRGTAGLHAAQQLSELTGADVAASNDLTGNGEFGADWELELSIGNVESASLQSSAFTGTLAVEATDGIVTVQDAENSAAGTVSLSNNGAPTTVTTSGTPFRVGQMLERIWQYSETADVGESTFVFDINGIPGITGSIAAEFGIIVSDQSDLSGTNTETLVASGYDAANGLVFFHGIDLQPGEYFGLATRVEPDNFSVFPTASGLEDTAIDLGLTLNPAITSGGTLRDIIDTDIGFRASTAGTTTTDFLIPAGSTGIKITGYSTRDIGTATNDARNDDYQSLNVSIDLLSETSNGFIAHLIDQGPARSDQFAWTDSPLGTAVLSGGGTITGDANNNINPTFSVDNGVLKIAENHQLQTAYHVEFLTNATSSAEFIQTASAVREDGDQANVTLATPAAADYLIISIADAATSSDSQVEYKGNSRIYVDLDTLTASGTVAAQRGETDDRVVSYAFENYDVSSAGLGSVLSTATVVGDTQETFGLLNDSQIFVDGSGNLVIDREDTFASNFNSLITVEYYERRDVGSSAELLGDSADYGLWDADPSDPTSILEFDIPANAELGILNLSMNGTRSSDTNENMGAGFAVIDLVNGTSSGTMYMVRTGNIVDFVAWDNTDFSTVFFDDPNSISNHTTINQFNDRFAGNAVFNLTNGGNTLELSTHSDRGTQTFLDYFAGGQIEWYGSAPFELSGFPVGGTFNEGSLNTATGNWDLTIQEALGGLFFFPDEHVSGTTPVDVSIIIGDEVETTQVRIEAVIDPISFDAFHTCDDEDTDIDISGLVTPTFVDQDGSETITGLTLSAVPIGHTLSDGTNTFVSSAGNQSVNITGWNQASLIYRANPNESGTYTITMDVDWQDVGGGVTDTDSMTTTFDIEVKPVNDAPIAVDDFHAVLGNTTLTVNAANGVLNNDSDIEMDSLTSTGPLSGPSSGTATLNPDGSFDYIPNSGFFGTDSFTYEVSDGNGGTDTATVYIEVSPPVIGPLDAIDDFETTDEETPINIAVMANDDLPTSGAFNIQSTTPPSNGVITVLPDGTIDYTPDPDFFGTDTFTYTLVDASGRMDTATVTVTVNNVQDPPVANADSGSTPEDTTLPNIDILSNDSDPDNDALTVTTATAPNGTVVINADGTIDYTPNANFNGTDIVTYTISDGNGGTATSTVLINIVPVADPPTSADHTVCFDEDTEYVFTAADFAFADGDPGDMLTTIRIDSLPVDGDLTLSGTLVTVGQVVSLSDINASRLVFRPAADGFGAAYATFDFSVSDGALFQVTPNTMTLCVNPVQDPPVATDSAIMVLEESMGTPLGLASPTDVDGDTLTVTVTGLPIVGTVYLADGVTPITNGQTLTVADLTGLVYDAPADYISGDPGDFTYDVTDGIDTDSGVVDITITPINDAPFVDLNGTAAGEDYKATFTEGGSGVGIVAASIDISDVDSANLQSLTITVGGVVDGAEEIVSIGGTDFVLTTASMQTISVGGTSFQVVYAAGTFTITEAGGGTIPVTSAEAFLAATIYRNESALPTETDRTFDISVTDDLGAVSNAPMAIVCVARDSEVAAWSLTGPATVIDGNVVANTLSLSAALRAGETASVDLAFADVDTNSSDYLAFATSLNAAVAAYSGPGTLTLSGSTLTFTSDGTGPMTPLAIPVTTTPDGVYEGDEDYTITLSNPASATGETISIAAGTVTTTIIDNDAAPTILIGDASELEGTPLEFTISLDLASVEDITLDLGLTNGSATVGTDVEATNFEFFDGTVWLPAVNGTEVTLPAGTTSLLVRIDSVQDGLVEPDETFTLGATVLAGTVTSATDTGTGQIVNEDVGTLFIDDVTIDEDNGTMVFTVSLDQPSASTVTVNYATTSGTATSGIDFTAASGVVTFAPGSQSETITVNVTNDNLFEQSETFDVNLSVPVGATIGDGLGVGTIIDDGTGPNGTDDDRPVISVNDVTATEDVDTHAVFAVSLSNPSTENIVLSLALADITATSGADYGPGLEFFDGTAWQPVTGNMTIAAGATAVQVRTPIIDDPIIDSGETYSLTATNVSGTTFNTSDTGIGTILDDPTPDTTIVEISGPPSVTEGNLATYTVSINNTPITDVTVTFTYAGTAIGGSDYTGVASVTIPAGSTIATFDIATIDDTLGEPLENFTVTIDSITGGSLEATAISTTDDAVTTNIIDDDIPTISINDVVVVEGTDPHAEFTVELSNPTFEDVDFDLTAASGSAIIGDDFGNLTLTNLEVFNGSIWVPATATTIPAGDITIRLRTPINDDAIAEIDETFTVTAIVTGGATLNPSTTGLGTIKEDTTALETVLVSLVGPASVVEGNTTTNYTLTLEEVPVADVTVTLVYTGTAADGSDFTGVATALIPTGSIAGTFTLPTVDDSLYEVSEDIIVTIESVTGGGFEGIGIDTTADAVTTTIIDVADIPTLSINNVVSVEGTDSFAVYTVELSNLSVEDVDFNLSLADVTAVGGGTDYGSSGAGNLQVFDGANWVDATSATIAAGTFSVQVRTPIIDDPIDEPNETYTLTVDRTAGTTTNVQIVGIGTIIDDDAAPDIMIDDASTVEGDPLVFDVTLSNPSSQPIVLDLSPVDVTAATTSDYSGVFEYSIDGGATWIPAASGTQFTVPALATAIQVRTATTEDTTLESTETMTLAIASVVSGTAGNTSDTATGTIIDDDAALVSIVANDPVAGEPSDNAQFTVSMTNPTDSPTVIAYSVSGSATSGVDYTALSGTITLPPGATSGLIDLTVLDDAIIEGLEDVIITLTSITSGDPQITIDAANDEATATITDDDAATWQLAGVTTVNEGAVAIYNVDLLGELQSGEAVSVVLSLSDNTTLATDYANFDSAVSAAVAAYTGPGSLSLVGTTLTFTSDGTGAMAQLPIQLLATNDAIVEGPEDYDVSISGAVSTTGAAINIDVANNTVNTTIEDTIDAVGTSNDTASWSISGPTTADEAATAQYTVSLDAALGANETATVDISLTDIDTNSSDYASFLAAVAAAAAVNPDVVFNVATGTLTYTVPSDGATMTDLVINLGITDDTIIEGPEDFQIDLTSPGSSSGAVIAIDPLASSVTTTIDDTQGIAGLPDGPAEWSITGPTSADEGTTAQYTVALSGQFGAGEVVTVDLGLADIDTNSSDYASILAAITAAAAMNPGVTFNAATGTLTYTAPSDGASMTDLVIDLGITDDTIIEGPEDFSFTLNNATTATGANVSIDAVANEVTTTINDTQGLGGVADGPAEWSITGTTSADEGTTAQYLVALSGQFGVGEVVTVDLGLTDIDTNSSDYASIVAAITAAAATNPDVTFNPATGTLTYTAPSDGASMTDLVIDLGITDDVIIEGPEDFSLALSNATTSTGANVSIDSAAIDVTTTINDTQGIGGAPDGPAEWSITGAITVDEGATAQYEIELSGAFGAGEVATINVSLAELTTNATDHAALLAALTVAAAANPDVNFNVATGTLTYIAPSDGATMTPLIVNVAITDDAFIEGSEQYNIALSNPGSTSGASISVSSTQDDVTTTINDTQGVGNDADGPAEWSIAGPAAVDEGATAQYTVALSGLFGAGEVVTVDLGLSDIDTNSTDYASIVAAISAAAAANPDVTFNAATGTLVYTSPSDGASMSDLIIDLGIVDDPIIEGPEDFSLTLSNATTSTGANVAIDLAAFDVTTTINDTQGAGGGNDGPAEWSITGPTSADEGATAQYIVALAGQFGAGEVVTVDLGLADIDTSSTDYASIVAAISAAAAANPDVAFDIATGTLTYTAPNDGAAMADLVIDLGITDDTIIEGPEGFSLTLTNVGTSSGANVTIDPAANDVTTTINDTQGSGGAADGPAEWSIVGPTAVDEGATAQYTVALSGQFGAGEVVTVDLGLADIDANSSDYTNIVAAITAATAANPDVAFNAATGTLTYTAPSDGASMADLVIDLGITDDTFIEGPEDYSLALANATTSTGASVAIDPAAEDVTTTINDTQGVGGATDGPAEWSIVGSTTVNEGAIAQYTVAITGQFGAGEVATVDLGLTDIDTNSSDYANIVAAITVAAAANPDVTFNAATGTLTYTSPNDGASMTDLVIDLGIVTDSLSEGPEDYSLALSNPATSSGAAVAVDATSQLVVTTIIDTTAPAEWSITGPTAVDEGATARYTVALSGQFGAGEVVTVDLGLTDIDTNSSDYASIVAAISAAAAANPDVTFNAATGTLTYTAPADGASMADLVIDLGIVDDPLIEGPEDYSLALSNATNSSGANVAVDPAADGVTTTINDTQGLGGVTDGPAEWSITGPTSVDEGTTAQYTVALSGQFGAGEVVTVDLGLTDSDTNSSDYASIVAAISAAIAANSDVTFNAATGTLTYIAPSDGASMTDLVIDLGIVDDVLLEGPEDYSLALTNATTSTGAAVSIDGVANNVTTTIDDTQGPGGAGEGPATWSITGTPEIGEGNSAAYTVALSGQFQAGEVLTIQLGLSDNATNGADYGGLSAEIAVAVAGNPDLVFDTVTGTLTYTAPNDGASMTPLVFALPITDDTIVESPEDYDIVLSNSTSPTGVANVIDPVAGSVNTIINGDPFVNDDIQHTTVGTPVSDNVLANDTDPDGDPLVVTTTPVVPPANGTLVLASNGSYTYTPNPGFRGVDSFDYEVCDDFGNCEIATVTIMMVDLSTSKSQVSVVPNGDNFDVEFTLTVENTGSTRMDNLSLFDDLATQFGPAFVSIGSLALDASGVVGGVAPSLNAGWTANTALDILDPAATNEFLLPGDSFSITFVITIDPDAAGTATAISNQATVAGEDITTIPNAPLATSDDSDSGSDPSSTNPGAPGDTGGEDDTTPLFIPDVRVVKQQVGTPIELSDRSWNVDFELFVENTGTTELTGVSLLDDSISQLGSVWQGSSNLSIDASGVSLGGVAPGLNTSWLSDPSQDILDGTGVLQPGESFGVTFTLNLDPDNTPSGLAQPITNQATATGIADFGSGPVVVEDVSDSGADANTTNSGAPGDTGGSDDPTPIEISEIGAAKRIVSSVPIVTSPGHVALTYEVRVRNLATNDLTNLTIQDNLVANLGPAFQGLVSPPTLLSSTASINPIFNSTFDGTSSIDLLDGASGLLRPGEEFVVQYSLDVQVDLVTSNSINQVLAGADDGGAGMTDLSDSGSDPAGSNPNTTGDTGGEDDPTLPPAIGIAKDHGTPVEVGESFLVPIDLVVRNLGVTNLSNLAIVEDLMSSFGPAFVGVSTPVVDATGVVGGTGPSVNGSWSGNTSNNLLDGSGTLTPNDEFTISFDVTIDPDATGTSQYLFNQAIVTASDPTNPGLQVVDTSDSGRDPASSNVGEPGDTGLTEDPTPLEITDIGLAKTLELRGQSGASFIVTIALFVENTGTVDLTNLSLIDDVSAEFAPHTVVVVAAPRFVASNATVDPNFNAGFVGDSSQDIFDLSSGLLAPGESFVVELDVQINPNFAATSDGGLQLANQATAGGEGVGSNGVILSAVSDASDSGTNPNSNNGDGGFSDATQISIGVFAFDSFNNFSQPFGQDVTRTPFLQPNPNLDSTYAGISAPGTTLSFNVYDHAGREIASRTVVADAAGNWLVSLSTVQDNGYQPNQQFNTFALQNSNHRLGSRAFVGSTLGHRLYHESVSLQQTHRVEVRQTPALHNIRLDSGNFRWTGQVHFQSALRPTSYFVDRTTVDRVFAESPSASLRALHMLNSNPLQLGLDANELESPVRSVSW